MRQESVGHAGNAPETVAEITHEDGTRLLVLAERLPHGAAVRVRRSEERRLASLIARARGATPAAAGHSEESSVWIDGELPPELVGHELCSAHFLSGAGWAWRVTATLARTRAGDERRPERTRSFRPVATHARARS